MISRDDVDIDKIMLNPDNPRLAEAKHNNQSKLDQAEVDYYLKASADDHQKALRASIITVGRITEPIHIQKLKKSEDGFEYVVLEGNNRLKVYKDLHKDFADKSDYKGQWKKIPCEVYENYDRDIYDQIQLTSHVITKKPWEPYARGEYLYKLQKSGKTLGELAAMCGGDVRKKNLQQEIDAYKHMQKWRDPERDSKQNELDYNPGEYQKFYQYQLKKSSFNDMGLSEDIFLDMIAQDKISYARDVRKLDTVWLNRNFTPEENEQVKNELMKDGGDTIQAFAERDRLLAKGKTDALKVDEIIKQAKSLTSGIRSFTQLSEREKLAKDENSVQVFDLLAEEVNDFIEELRDIQKYIVNN